VNAAPFLIQPARQRSKDEEALPSKAEDLEEMMAEK